jgi:AcrR family transcriptional regulator
MPARRSDAASGTGSTRELRARGLATRERLLEAGSRVFAGRGVHSARVDDIVKEAATSHGTFYLYFANKEELFHALAEQVAGELEALATRLPPLTPDADGVAALDAWLREFGDLYSRTGPVIRAWTETEMVATAMGRLGTVVWAAFTTALVERIRATGVDGIDPVMAALALVAMIERANYYVLTAQAPAPDGTLPATLARVTHGAIFGDA